MRKLSTCLVVALLGGALLVACGSKSSTSSQTVTNSGTGSENSNGSSGSGSTGSGSTGSGSTGSGSNNSGSGVTGKGGESLAQPSKAATAQEVEACKQNVQKLPVPAEGKKKLEASCVKAKTVQAQRKVVHEACEVIAEQLPPGPGREHALQVCHLGP